MKNGLIFLFVICSTTQMMAQTEWQPAANRRVPVIEDCSIGDIAIARSSPQPHIRYCPTTAAAMNNMFPGVGHFYFVHEYGHIYNGESEVGADLFAAQQLARLNMGYYYINAMLSHLYHRSSQGEGSHPRYGTPAQRAARIRSGATAANSNLRINSQSLLLYE